MPAYLRKLGWQRAHDAWVVIELLSDTGNVDTVAKLHTDEVLVKL